MEVIHVVILTKSAKHGNYCVAGINSESGKWVRLVSDDERTMFALTHEMVKYEDGNECEVLDIVKVCIREAVPLSIQSENVLIDDGYYWEYVGKYDLESLRNLAKKSGYIFGNINSYVDKNIALETNGSLGLYFVENIVLSTRENNNGIRRKKVSFVFDGRHHSGWSMTDHRYFRENDGKISDEGIIVVSIPEDDYNGNYYKFVAQIFAL